MSDPSSLCLINDKGTVVNAPVLQPFFETLLPALRKKARKITITATSLGDGKQSVSAEYVHRGKVSILTVDEGVRAFDTITRIRIFSGMSIKPDTEQSGKMLLRFGENRLPIDVQIMTQSKRQTLVLTPIWSQKEE